MTTLSDILALPYVGEGTMRTVYRDGNNVYKVENEEGIEYSANENEYRRYMQHCDDLPPFILFPRTDLIYIGDERIPVIVAEYVEGIAMGDCSCPPGNLEFDHDTVCLPVDIECALDGFDLAYGNVIFDGSFYWMVDI